MKKTEVIQKLNNLFKSLTGGLFLHEHLATFEKLISSLNNDQDKYKNIKQFFILTKNKIDKEPWYEFESEFNFFKKIINYIKDKKIKIITTEYYIEDRKKLILPLMNKYSKIDQDHKKIVLLQYEKLLLSLYNIENPDAFIKDLYKSNKLKEFKESTFKYFYDLYPDIVFNNLDLFLNSYNYLNSKKQYLIELQKIDSSIIRNLDFYLLQDKYTSIFTPYQLCLISHDIYLMYFLHNICENEYKFIKYILKGLKHNNDFNEYFYYIKHNMSSYSYLINHINFNALKESELFILKKLITYENVWDIKKLSDLNNIDKLYDQTFSKACKKYLEEGTGLDKIKEIITLKKYGIDIPLEEKVKSLEEESEPQIYKEYTQKIDRIINLEKLIEEYRLIEEIHPLIDKISYIRYYRSKYEDIYNKQLFNISQDSKIIIDGITYYDPGDKFYILMTSKSPIIKTKESFDNLKQDWNRKDVESSFFCASLISNYMLNFCETNQKVYYGFNRIEKDTLLSMGPDDLGSYTDIDCFSISPAFLTPYNLCFNTVYRYNPCYNEIDIKRYNKNKRVQPDFIICFKINGQIKNKKESLQASKQFDNLPVVLIDIDKYINNSLKELKEYINIYKQNKSKKLKDIIFEHTILFFRLCKKYNVIPCIDETEIYSIFNEKKGKYYNLHFYI